MSAEYQREYLVRLPLPLAQLYDRAHNAKDARARYDNTFYLFEALIKLAAAPAIACYLHEVEQGSPRSKALDRLLAQLALPSLGQWVGMLRELARHFGQRPDASSHPLGHLWGQLDNARRERPDLLALYRRIKHGADGQPAGDQICSLLEVFDALVQYRNDVIGHGGPRFDSFFTGEMGPLLFPAANEILAEGTFDLLGPRGSRLVYASAEMRQLDEDRVEVGLRELIGKDGERAAPLPIGRSEAPSLAGRVAVVWPGWPVPLRLDPLLLYREGERSSDMLFLNRDLNGRQVQYLNYSTGRTERDRATAPALAALLSRITGHEVSEAQLEAFAEQSRAATPSVESLFEPTEPVSRVLGGYEILAEIGRGGMGVVFLARQLSLGRLVAIKMLPADLAGDEVALARFRRELRLLARCEHPNIVMILDSGTMPNGQLYYAMEYIPGCNLDQVWRELSGSDHPGDASALSGSSWQQAVHSASRKAREQATRRTQPASLDLKSPQHPVLRLHPLADLRSAPDDPGGYTRRVVMLVRDAARALQAIHDQGVVHRDVKPANLMLTPDGSRVVLMDFGLAKGQSLDLTSTRSGGLLGTLRYAAPEQLAAARLKVGPTADVRGLGVVLWELLTRRRLFGSATDERELTECVFGDDVPRLRTIDPSLGRDLDAIVARATERRAADRIASAGRLADYLQLYLDGLSLPIRPPTAAEMLGRWMRCHKPLVWSAAAAFLAIVTTVAIAFALITRSRDEKARLAEKETWAKNEASELAGKLGVSLKDTERERKNAFDALSDFYLERGRSLCLQGNVGQGVLWYAHALRYSTVEESTHDAVVRSNLAAWARQVCPLSQVFDSEWDKAAFSPDGKTLLVASRDKKAQLWSTVDFTPIGQPLKHTANVRDVAFSPDGKTMFTVSGDHAAQLWTVDGSPIGPPLRHGSWINALAFSPDGKTVVTGSDDCTARLWSAIDGSPVGRPISQVDTEDVRAVAFSADGKTMLTGADDRTARLWSAADGTPIGKPLVHADKVVTVAFSPDGKTVLTGSDDCTARLWSAIDGSPIGKPLVHGANVVVVKFSADGKAVLTGSEDSTARLWRAFDGTPIGKPLVHADNVITVALSPDGKTVCTGSRDRTARFWKASDGSPIGRPLEHGSWVSAVAFSPDGKTVITGSDDHSARLWRASDGSPIGRPFINDNPITALTFSPDGKTVLTCGGSVARLLSAADGSPTGKPIEHEGFIYALAFSPDGKTLMTGGDHSARLWRVADGSPILKVLEHENWVLAAAFSPDGKTFLTGGHDSACLWSTEDGSQIGPQLRHLRPRPIRALAFSPDGTTVLTGSDRSGQLWSAADGSKIGSPIPFGGSVNAVAFSPDGKTLVIGGSALTAQLRSVGGLPIGRPIEAGYINALAFSPDGKTLLTGGSDNSARLWSAIDGSPVGQPMWHEGWVRVVAFSPDGKTILTSGDDYTVRLWSADAGLPIGPPIRHVDKVRHAAFSPDGRALLALSRDLRVWSTIEAKDTGHVVLRDFASKFSISPDGTTVLKVKWKENSAQFWSTRDGTSFGPPLRHGAEILSLDFSPDGKTVVTGSDDKTARIWNVADGTPIGSPMQHESPVQSVEFSPDGKTILTSAKGRSCRLWSAADGSPVANPLGDADGSFVVAVFSEDGKAVLTNSGHHTARLLSVADGLPIGPPIRPDGGFDYFVLSPDGNTFVTSGYGGTCLWNALDGSPVLRLEFESGPTGGFAFSPDGKTLAGGIGKSVQIWNCSDGSPAGPTFEHSGNVRALRFSPDGKSLVTWEDPATAHIWTVADRKRRGQPIRHSLELSAAPQYSPDGKLILTTSRDNTAQLWSATDGSPIGPPFQQPFGFSDWKFSADGRVIVTDGGTQFLQVPMAVAGEPGRLVLWLQVVTGMEIVEKTHRVDLLDAPVWRERRRRLDAMGGPPPL